MKEQEEILRVMERMPEHGIKTELRRSHRTQPGFIL